MKKVFKRTNKIFLKVKTRLVVTAKYATQKARYSFSLKTGVTDRKKNSKLLNDVNDYDLNVFLSRRPEEITAIIKKDKTLYELVVGAGERTYNNEWLILNEYRSGMYDDSIGHYRWTEDFFTGYKYKDCFYLDARKQETLPNTDVKIPWETSRMQYLFSLALAYRATSDEKYAKKIKAIIEDFDVCCPVGHGVNWHVSMEVGIRIANILLACEIAWDSPSFDAEFKHLVAMIAYEHMHHIRKNIENVGNGGNHLLADILGLSATSAAMPFLPGAKKCKLYAHKMLHREIVRQILPDGGHFEGSISYHRLVGEILAFSIKAQKNSGLILTKEEKERLHKMGELTCALRMNNGLLPQVGDNDSGRVFQLVPENTRDHDSFINLISELLDNTIAYPQKKDGFFCFYDIGAKTDNLQYPENKVMEFPFFKVLRYKKDDVFLVFCGMTPEIYGKSGHTHNDVLSFVLSMGEEEIFTDPGSGEYTGDLETRHKMRAAHSHSVISVDGGEQRLLLKNKALAFNWGSMVTSSLRIEENDGEKTVFAGECSYKNEQGEVITQKRFITIRKNSIDLVDWICGMKKNCDLYLPIYPGLEAEVADREIVINGKNKKCYIEGSYTFSLQKSLYAEQYKKIIQNETIKCRSELEENLLKIKLSN